MNIIIIFYNKKVILLKMQKLHITDLSLITEQSHYLSKFLDLWIRSIDLFHRKCGNQTFCQNQSGNDGYPYAPFAKRTYSITFLQNNQWW